MRWKNVRFFVEPYVCRFSLEVRWDIKAMQCRRMLWSGQEVFRVKDVLHGAELAVVESFASHHRIAFSQISETEEKMQRIADLWRQAKAARAADSITPNMSFPVMRWEEMKRDEYV